MKHPQTFLLEKIVGHKGNGLSSLGQLDAKHVDDIAEVMKQFGEQLVLDVIDRLDKGESISAGGMTFRVKKKKK